MLRGKKALQNRSYTVQCVCVCVNGCAGMHVCLLKARLFYFCGEHERLQDSLCVCVCRSVSGSSFKPTAMQSAEL